MKVYSYEEQLVELSAVSCRNGPLHESESHERRLVLLPPIASEDGRSASVGFRIGAALAVESDYAVDDIPAMDASQSRDSASSFTDNLGHSQAGTTGALHNLSLYTVVSYENLSVVSSE